MVSSPIEKYEKRAQKVGSLLCVGLDPDFSKLPEQYLKEEFPQFSFNKNIIDVTHQYVSAYKPNPAFYEAEGAKGIEALKKTCDYIKENHPDIFIIIDAKRGDIGNTNLGYGEFVFDYLGADAMTFQPYLGRESMQALLDRKDKSLIILARTSNLGAGEIQDLIVEGTGKTIWETVSEKVIKDWNENNNTMIVVGATYPEEMKRIREMSDSMTLLVPGLGAQGGDTEKAVRSGINSRGLGMIINSSRGIIFSNDPAGEAKKLRDDINSFI